MRLRRERRATTCNWIAPQPQHHRVSRQGATASKFHHHDQATSSTHRHTWHTPNMAQAAVAASNGSHALDGPESTQPVAFGKRKRDSADEGDDVDGDKASALVEASAPPTRDQRELAKSCFDVLTRYVYNLSVPCAAVFLHPFRSATNPSPTASTSSPPSLSARYQIPPPRTSQIRSAGSLPSLRHLAASPTRLPPTLTTDWAT